MEFIEGDTLSSIVKKGHPVAESDIVDWGIQLCDALSYLHERGFVLCNLRPDNILLTNSGTIKLMEFGAMLIHAEGGNPAAMGAPGYSDPDTLIGALKLDQRSDIYSLGATLFYLATRHNPFEYAIKPALPPIRLLNPALSKSLEHIIAKATQRNPSARYPSCNEMRYDLEMGASAPIYASPPRGFFGKLAHIVRRQR